MSSNELNTIMLICFIYNELESRHFDDYIFEPFINNLIYFFKKILTLVERNLLLLQNLLKIPLNLSKLLGYCLKRYELFQNLLHHALSKCFQGTEIINYLTKIK